MPTSVRAKRSKNPNHWNVYKRKRNDVVNRLKYTKKKFFSHLTPSNPKLFWKTTKALTKGVSGIPFLKDDSGEIITDNTAKATTLNNFFSTCFNSCTPPLSESDRHMFSHLTSNECPSEMLCTEEQVLELLLSLDTTKANGPDGISATMLKATVHSIAPGVTLLFNKSIKHGALPKEWKVSAVNPIPKSGDKNEVSNNGPISLPSILSKLLEKHMHKLIFNHIESCSSAMGCPSWKINSLCSSGCHPQLATSS